MVSPVQICDNDHINIIILSLIPPKFNRSFILAHVVTKVDRSEKSSRERVLLTLSVIFQSRYLQCIRPKKSECSS